MEKCNIAPKTLKSKRRQKHLIFCRLFVCSIQEAPATLMSVRFYFSVESSDVCWKRKKSDGIRIVCQSDMRDFSAMAFITDHVHTLIEQWFPGQCSGPCVRGLRSHLSLFCSSRSLFSKDQGDQKRFSLCNVRA